MTDIVKGMTAVAYKAQYGAEFDSLRDGVREKFMRAALLWYAAQLENEGKHFVAGEVRAAAGEEGK